MPFSPGPNLRIRFLLPLLACACAESNLEPVSPKPLTPPASYRTWWTEVEICANRTASFERIRWFQAEQVINRDEGTDHVGAWYPPHSIFIRSDRILYEAGVKHEMVHDLLQIEGHDSPAFPACAGV